ncbi:MAG TPA: WYL domain-containing protein [Streptosporangiaceae bacterium]|nr:WYL domain-containing protein [Streptosporangiaceae bacterium]
MSWPFRPAAAATSQRILVDPAGWMRAPEPVGELGVLQAAVFTDRRLRLGYRSSGQRATRERVVDPYGLVCKGGIWYLVADSEGEPRLFRVSRVVSAVVDEEPVRRRDGVELAGLWASLRREVEDRPAPLEVLVREWLDLFGRMCAANLAGPLPFAAGEWTEVRLRYPGVKAARPLLSFGANVEVTSPASVRADLAEVAAEVVACYQS